MRRLTQEVSDRDPDFRFMPKLSRKEGRSPETSVIKRVLPLDAKMAPKSVQSFLCWRGCRVSRFSALTLCLPPCRSSEQSRGWHYPGVCACTITIREYSGDQIEILSLMMIWGNLNIFGVIEPILRNTA
jgi:hypothetical protein